MKNQVNKAINKLISLALALCVALTSVLASPELEVHADETRILTLGNDLTEEQKQLVLNYLGVSEDDVVVVTVTNEDEHALLDNIATQQQIGQRTYSCSYIEPTTFGGIHIKTVNLTWVTCDMIRNALVTSGIVNCNIICVAPIQVSGTGALTGIFKAYEQVAGEEISEERQLVASEELVTTCTIAGTVGQEEASEMVSDLKEEILTEEVDSEEVIEQVVRTYMAERNIELSEDDVWALVGLLVKIADLDYDVEEIKQAYADVKETVAEVKEAKEEAVTLWGKIVNFFKTLWLKITGAYDEFMASEAAQDIKDTIGILSETNDELLGDSTVVTNTVDEEVLSELDTEQAEETTDSSDESDEAGDEDESHWYDFILDFFNAGNKEETDDSSTSGSDEVTFEDFSSESESESDDVEQTEESSSALDDLVGDTGDSSSDTSEAGSDAEQSSGESQGNSSESVGAQSLDDLLGG